MDVAWSFAAACKKLLMGEWSVKCIGEDRYCMMLSDLRSSAKYPKRQQKIMKDGKSQTEMECQDSSNSSEKNRAYLLNIKCYNR